MLESMTTNPRPTRAEVSDVANAILDGADCVMLSGETAKGKYPVEAVEMMHHVCLLAESVICYPPLFEDIRHLTSKPTSSTETVACSAVTASEEHQAGAIIVLTTSGNSARLISKYRPRVPILTVTRDPVVSRQTHLYRGCYPILYPHERNENWQDDINARIHFAVEEGIRYGLMNRGDKVIAVQGWCRGGGNTNTMRVLETNDDMV
jgi:pyruvate kinase